MKGLYIHIPFCKTICSYCDFKKQLAYKNIDIDYIKALIEEIDSKKEELSNINTVYIGGGTPNSLSLDSLRLLLDAIKPYLNQAIEATIELNPELVDEKLAKMLADYKISRVSLGIQSINPHLIKLLNRHHTKEIVLNAYNILNKYINNINFDLMFGIPTETFDDIEADIALIEELKPKHISYYSLILEPRTILYNLYNKNKIELLDDDIIADMNILINSKLKKLGYKHYETSNYAIEGYESKHNLIYWSMDEYVGIGLAACGFINNQRIENTHILKDYLNKEKPTVYPVSFIEKRSEFMFLGLRKLDGISLDRYKELFNSNPIDDYKLSDLIEKKILLIEDGRLKIDEAHIFVSNQILVRFVGDEND